jgi:hypothetical protein
MRIPLAFALLSLAFSSCSTPPEPATKLQKAAVLPLEINDKFQFRKIKQAYFTVGRAPVTDSEPVLFERQRLEWGAVDRYQLQQRYGNYYTFFWRTSEQADVTVRMEYRQAALGNYVMAMERYYPQAKCSYRSEFSTAGDDYWENGRVTSWRVLLIVDGRIVALRQSFMWR